MSGAPTSHNGATVLALALDRARQRRALLETAVLSFRALAPQDRLEFLVLVEGDLVEASQPQEDRSLVVPVPPSMIELLERATVPPPSPPAPGAPVELLRDGRRPSYGPKEIQQVVDLCKQGLTDAEIAAQLGYPIQTVGRLRRGAGLVKEHRGPSRRPPAAVAEDDGEPAPAPPSAPSAPEDDEEGAEDDRPCPPSSPSPFGLSRPALPSENVFSLLGRDAELELAARIITLEEQLWQVLVPVFRTEIAAWMYEHATTETLEAEPLAAARQLRKLDLETWLLRELAGRYAGDRVVDVRAWYVEAKRHRDHFVTANLRLVFSVARKSLWSQIPLEDLAQEGNLGLLRAISTYDPARGMRFSTYAVWWIKHEVGRYIVNKGDLVRVPVHLHESVQKISRSLVKLKSKLGRAPSVPELAKASAFPEKVVRKILERHATEHGDVRVSQGKPVSLDVPLADGVRTRGDMIVDPASEGSPLDALLTSEQEHKRVHAALAQLCKESPRLGRVMRLRYGLDSDDEKERTLREVGELDGVSRERIRQMETIGLRRLRTLLEDIR